MKFKQLPQRLKAALEEDRARFDITTRSIPGSQNITAQARFLAKKDGVFCGGALISPLFKLLSPTCAVSKLVKDGTRVRAGQTLGIVRGPMGALLSGERTALNFICHLSGIATLTRRYADAVKGTSAAILETRKTTPLWRDLEKYAVKCGGGTNHRFSLEDAVLVKDNHIAIAKKKGLSLESIYGEGAPVRRRKNVGFVAIEADTYADVWNAIKLKPDIILLDNMPLNRLKGSIVFIKAAREALGNGKPLIEVSGGVTIQEAKTYAKLGIDRISVGALTHSAPVLDISLEF